MKAMLVYTASSCGVSASGISETAPTVPWMVSSSVRPVNTRIVSSCSSAVSVFHDCTSLDSGTFSGSQKLPVRRFQTSRSLSSSMRFQLIASTWLTSCSFGEGVIVLRSCSQRIRGCASQHAADALGHVGPLERHLPQADVVDRLDALAPCVDLRLVDVAGGGGVLEEQRQRQPLVDVLRGDGIRVDDLLVADLVCVLVVLQVVVRHEGSRVVHAAELALLSYLDRRSARVDRRGRVFDVGDRAGRGRSLQVLVVDAVLPGAGLQLDPGGLRGDVVTG